MWLDKGVWYNCNGLKGKSCKTYLFRFFLASLCSILCSYILDKTPLQWDSYQPENYYMVCTYMEKQENVKVINLLSITRFGKEFWFLWIASGKKCERQQRPSEVFVASFRLAFKNDIFVVSSYDESQHHWDSEKV